MKALSIDLRQRIVSAYERGEGSQRALAERFSVSRSSVERFIRLKRRVGSVAPKPHAGGRACAVRSEADRSRLLRWIKCEPDLTQAEMAERFEVETGRPTSQQSMSRALRRLGITRKKRP